MAITKIINGRSIKFDVCEDSDGNPAFMATHVDGVKTPAGYIAGILPDGTLVRYGHVDSCIGLKLTSSGHIKQRKE